MFIDKLSTHDKIAHPHLSMRNTRFPDSQLRIGLLAAHGQIRLMLLGSPPDMIHGSPLRETDPSTPLIRTGGTTQYPGAGVHPCYSGLQATGHRYLPD